MKLIIALMSVIVILSIGCNSDSKLKGTIFITNKDGKRIKLGSVEVVAIAERDIVSFIEEKRLDPSLAADILRRQNALKVATKNFDIASDYYSLTIDRFTFANMKFATSINSGTTVERMDRQYDSTVAQAESDRAGLIKKNKAEKMDFAQAELSAWPEIDFFFKDIPLNKAVKVTSDASGKFRLNLAKGKYAIAAHSRYQISDSTEHYYWFFWINIDDESKSIVLSDSNLMETNSSDSIMKVGSKQ